MTSPRVLSIQSHVVCGYVGNKCSVFPLHLHGFQVDAINSVQFSNHTQYANVKGQVLKSQDLEDLYSALKANNVHKYDYITSGYIGDVSFLKSIAKIVKELRELNPQIKYICDPVLGDNGRFYVPQELAAVYRDEIVPIADVLLPNQFEAEQLTGLKVESEADGWKVCKALHDKGRAKCVIISSSSIADKNEHIVSMGSFNYGKEKVKAEIPVLPGNFTGSGDVFAAAYLIWSHKTQAPDSVFGKAVNTTYAVLSNTYNSFKSHPNPSAFETELKLIQSKEVLENPPDEIKVVVV